MKICILSCIVKLKGALFNLFLCFFPSVPKLNLCVPILYCPIKLESVLLNFFLSFFQKTLNFLSEFFSDFAFFCLFSPCLVILTVIV